MPWLVANETKKGNCFVHNKPGLIKRKKITGIKTLLFIIIVITGVLSCHNNSGRRAVANPNKKTLIDMRNDFGKPTLIAYYKSFYDNAFRLKPLEESEYSHEIGVYFEHSFGHTAFR